MPPEKAPRRSPPELPQLPANCPSSAPSYITAGHRSTRLLTPPLPAPPRSPEELLPLSPLPAPPSSGEAPCAPGRDAESRRRLPPPLLPAARPLPGSLLRVFSLIARLEPRVFYKRAGAADPAGRISRCTRKTGSWA